MIVHLISWRGSTQSFSVLLPFPPKTVVGRSVPSMHSDTKYWKKTKAHSKIKVGKDLSIHKTQSSVRSDQAA